MTPVIGRIFFSKRIRIAAGLGPILLTVEALSLVIPVLVVWDVFEVDEVFEVQNEPIVAVCLAWAIALLSFKL